MIEVRYAGVVVGRSAIVRELDTRGLFLGITEPMPVGTPVVLRIGDRPGADEVPGTVEVVSEATELANAGMRVRFTDPKAAALFGTPAQAPPEPAPAPPHTAPPPHTLAQPGTPAQPGHRPVASPPVAPASSPSAAAGAPASLVTSAVPSRGRDQEAPEAPASTSGTGGHRRIVVDASADRARAAAVPAAPLEVREEEGDLSEGVSTDTGRIPAPDPAALGGGGGGKKGRRNRRR